MTEWLLDLMEQIRDGVYTPKIQKEPTEEDVRAANNIVERFKTGSLSEDVYIGFVSAWLRKTHKEDVGLHLWREWNSSQAQQ